MKHGKLKSADQLEALLTQQQMDVPSTEFSDKLLHASMTSYRVSYSTKYRKEERLGKIIMVILLFFNLMMLYILKPFGIHSAVLLGLLALIVGVGLLFRMNITAIRNVFARRKFKTQFTS